MRKYFCIQFSLISERALPCVKVSSNSPICTLDNILSSTNIKMDECQAFRQNVDFLMLNLEVPKVTDVSGRVSLYHYSFRFLFCFRTKK
jgi:hypothetical protein